MFPSTSISESIFATSKRVAGVNRREVECGVCYYLLVQMSLNRPNTSYSVYEDEIFSLKTA